MVEKLHFSVRHKISYSRYLDIMAERCLNCNILGSDILSNQQVCHLIDLECQLTSSVLNNKSIFLARSF